MNINNYRFAAIATIILCALMILLTYQSIGQSKPDTIYRTSIRVPYNVLVNKFGTITKVWYRKVRVIIKDKNNRYYILKNADGNYVINDRVMKPDYIKLP